MIAEPPASGAESHAPAAGPLWPDRDANSWAQSGYGTIGTVYGPVAFYPVGTLEALRLLRRHLIHCRETGLPHRQAWKAFWGRECYLRRALRLRQWRAVRQHLTNGWMAEPVWNKGEGPAWRRCGTGWTPERSLRRLEREIWEASGGQRSGR